MGLNPRLFILESIALTTEPTVPLLFSFVFYIVMQQVANHKGFYIIKEEETNTEEEGTKAES